MKHSSTPKLYHSIKEIGEMFDEEQHILRYWEREFDCLRPSKNRAGNRVYTEKDIRVLKVIKKLLRVDRLPVVTVREMLKDGIPESLMQGAEGVLSEVVSVQETLKPEVSDADFDYVRLRRSDLQRVIALLRDVAGQIENL